MINKPTASVDLTKLRIKCDTVFFCFSDRASQYNLATDQLNAQILVL